MLSLHDTTASRPTTSILVEVAGELHRWVSGSVTVWIFMMDTLLSSSCPGHCRQT